jgi:4-hydroxy-4-methyl-2-oxoglutarate aldolase
MIPNISDHLAACYTGVLHDVMRSAGLRDFTLPSELRPLFPERSMAGPAFTVEGKVVAGSDAHDTLLAWTKLLSKAPSGTVWVSQPNDHVVAHMGELSAETLRNKGLRGCVVDGLIRDVNFILTIGFQVWSRGSTPRDIVGYWLPAATDTTIRIGDVAIASGDYLVGDRDGLIRVPKLLAEDIATKAEAAMATESMVRRAILDGTDPQDAYLKYGKF